MSNTVWLSETPVSGITLATVPIDIGTVEGFHSCICCDIGNRRSVQLEPTRVQMKLHIFTHGQCVIVFLYLASLVATFAALQDGVAFLTFVVVFQVILLGL